MPQNRYYSPQPFATCSEVLLKNDELHYLRSVMRTRVGEEIELINGKGGLAHGVVKTLTDKEAKVALTDVTVEAPFAFSLTLALAFLKPAHFEYAVEKATEVGVSRFLLFPGQLSEKRAISEQYLKRLETITLSATKQCGRLFLPEIVVKEKLVDCLQGEGLIFGDLESSEPLSTLTPTQSTTLVIGPESGFTEAERKLLIEKGAKGRLLHPNTLRAETAAIVGTARLFELLGIFFKLK